MRPYSGEFNPLPPSDAVRKRKKNILEDLSSSVLLQLKKYHPPRNLKINYLGIFQNPILRISRGANLFNFSLAKFLSKYFELLWVKDEISNNHINGKGSERFQLMWLLNGES